MEGEAECNAIAKEDDKHCGSWDNFAAELTDAVYQVMLRHGLGNRWLEAQLKLWDTMKRVIEKRPR